MRGLELLKKAHALAPNSSAIHLHLAQAYSVAGDRNNAIVTLGRLLDVNASFEGRDEAIRLYNSLKQSN